MRLPVGGLLCPEYADIIRDVDATGVLLYQKEASHVNADPA